MPLLIGLALGGLTFLFAKLAGLDRDRAFYPLLTIVVASYYVLFAVMGGAGRAVIVESLVMAVFAAAAVLGFKSNLLVVAAALAAHGVFDSIHGSVITNPGVPAWWPAFCSAFDLAVAACLAALIYSRRDKTFI